MRLWLYTLLVMWIGLGACPPAEAKIQFKGFVCFLLLPVNSQQERAVPLHHLMQEGQQFKIALRPLTPEPLALSAFRATPQFGAVPLEFSFHPKQGLYTFPPKNLYFVFRNKSPLDQILIVASPRLNSSSKDKERRATLQKQPPPSSSPPPSAPRTSPPPFDSSKPSSLKSPLRLENGDPLDAHVIRSLRWPVTVLLHIHRMGNGVSYIDD